MNDTALKGIWLCDACGRIETQERECHCWKCEAGIMVYWTGEQINATVCALDEVVDESSRALSQLIEWRGTIRETGYDGAREIVDAYKNLRSILRFAQANLSESDTSTFGKAVKQKIDDALGRMK